MRYLVFASAVFFAVLANTASSYADDWTAIACLESKIAVPNIGDQECKRGPESAQAGCVIDRFLAWSSSANFTVQIHMANQVCYLKRVENPDAEVKTFFPWISDASNWSPPRNLAGATGAHMLHQGNHCFSFYKPGPDRSGSGGSGVVWYIFGVYCAPAGEELDDQAVSNFINSIEVR